MSCVKNGVVTPATPIGLGTFRSGEREFVGGVCLFCFKTIVSKTKSYAVSCVHF